MDDPISSFRKIPIMNTEVTHHSVIPIPILFWLPFHFSIIEPFFSFMNSKNYTSSLFLSPTNCRSIHKFWGSRALISPYTTHQVIVDLHSSNNSCLFHIHNVLHCSTRENEIILQINSSWLANCTSSIPKSLSRTRIVLEILWQLSQWSEFGRNIFEIPFIYTTSEFMLQVKN